MSVKLMSRVWDSSPYSDAKLLIHLALADWADDDGTRCFPSHATVAAKCRCSTRTVERHLAAMVADGVLEVIEDSGRARKGKSRREYVVHPTTPPPPTDCRVSSDPTPDNDDPDTRQLLQEDASRIPPSTRARGTTKEPSRATDVPSSSRPSENARASSDGRSVGDKSSSSVDGRGAGGPSTPAWGVAKAVHALRKPPPKMGVRQVAVLAQAFLDAGHAVEVVQGAMISAATCSQGSVEIELAKRPRQSRRGVERDEGRETFDWEDT